MRDEILAFEADHVWISENLESLVKEYADQWIAVKDGRVVASNADFSSFLRALPDPGRMCVEYVTGDRLEMVL